MLQVTRRRLPTGGEVVYVGCGIEAPGLEALATDSLRFVGHPSTNTGDGAVPTPQQPEAVEIVRRGQQTVWINHGEHAWRMADGHELQPYEVRIVAANLTVA